MITKRICLSGVSLVWIITVSDSPEMVVRKKFMTDTHQTNSKKNLKKRGARSWNTSAVIIKNKTLLNYNHFRNKPSNFLTLPNYF